MIIIVTMASGKWTERNKIQANGPFGAVLITFMKSFGRPQGYGKLSNYISGKTTFEKIYHHKGFSVILELWYSLKGHIFLRKRLV